MSDRNASKKLILEQTKLVELSGGNPLTFLTFYDKFLDTAIELTGNEALTPEALFHVSLGMAAVLGQTCAVGNIPVKTITAYIETFQEAFSELAKTAPTTPEEVVNAVDKAEETVLGPSVEDWSTMDPSRTKNKLPN